MVFGKLRDNNLNVQWALPTSLKMQEEEIKGLCSLKSFRGINMLWERIAPSSCSLQLCFPYGFSRKGCCGCLFSPFNFISCWWSLRCVVPLGAILHEGWYSCLFISEPQTLGPEQALSLWCPIRSVPALPGATCQLWLSLQPTKAEVQDAIPQDCLL